VIDLYSTPPALEHDHAQCKWKLSESAEMYSGQMRSRWFACAIELHTTLHQRPQMLTDAISNHYVGKTTVWTLCSYDGSNLAMDSDIGIRRTSKLKNPLYLEGHYEFVGSGVVAGASIAGAALLLVLAFLVWLFGFQRRKATTQQPTTQPYPQQVWQQPELQQAYGVDSKTVHAPTVYGNGYAPTVKQDPPGTWAHRNPYELSELPGEQHGRQ
jgi:hypothetical protein